MSRPRAELMLPPDLRSAIDPKAPLPLFVQIKEALLHGLRNGAWDAESPIPSERQLMTELGVSRATVRQAIQELEIEGWLVRRQGRGTFPHAPKVEQRLELLAGFSDNMRAQGLEPSSRLVGRRLANADPRVARALGILPGAPVALIERVRLVNADPLLYEISAINEALAPDLLEQDLSGSLYALLGRRYRLVLAHGEETLEAVAADRDLARHLDIPEGSPLVYTERTVSTDRGQAVEFTRRWGRGDKSSFRVTLSGGNTQITRKHD
ncbi:GntR family transcriptional regulator [Arsenicitalea aurantiaca]|uniref:GntR family transcriptional regulator n=1 Tax=Arsenicitalea aurantiaca TaxID=1783274 RepID=A0A433X820_9HYPH|nr:GntR family transcriptional regulator [Arsenicitalea aurantiaca]RUT30231.1 GntR family transcriptional regulator [Arsenicitalea aurantiaca]